MGSPAKQCDGYCVFYGREGCDDVGHCYKHVKDEYYNGNHYPCPQKPPCPLYETEEQHIKKFTQANIRYENRKGLLSKFIGLFVSENKVGHAIRSREEVVKQLLKDLMNML